MRAGDGDFCAAWRLDLTVKWPSAVSLPLRSFPYSIRFWTSHVSGPGISWLNSLTVPVVFLWVMVAVGQIFKMTFEFQLVHECHFCNSTSKRLPREIWFGVNGIDDIRPRLIWIRKRWFGLVWLRIRIGRRGFRISFEHDDGFQQLLPAKRGPLKSFSPGMTTLGTRHR